jgi:hypothetical protein
MIELGQQKNGKLEAVKLEPAGAKKMHSDLFTRLFNGVLGYGAGIEWVAEEKNSLTG